MLTVFKANPVLAEMDIFVTLPDQQWQLVDSLIDYSKTILKQQPGYVGECYSPQLDGMRVTNYVQSQSDYETYSNNRSIALATKITGFFAPDTHLYEIFIVSQPTAKCRLQQT